MPKGGKRLGAGRPRGSLTVSRPKIHDFVTKEEVKELVEKAKSEAKAGRPEILKFLLEQIFGRAPLPISGDVGNQTPIPILHILSKKQL